MPKSTKPTRVIRRHLITESSKTTFPPWQSLVTFLRKKTRTNVWKCPQKPDGRIKLLSQNPEYRNLGEMLVEKRNQLIDRLSRKSAAVIRPLSRVLGLGKMMVERALK